MSKQEPQFIPNVCYIKLINKSIRDFLAGDQTQKKKIV